MGLPYLCPNASSRYWACSETADRRLEACANERVGDMASTNGTLVDFRRSVIPLAVLELDRCLPLVSQAAHMLLAQSRSGQSKPILSLLDRAPRSHKAGSSCFEPLRPFPSVQSQRQPKPCEVRVMRPAIRRHSAVSQAPGESQFPESVAPPDRLSLHRSPLPTAAALFLKNLPESRW